VVGCTLNSRSAAVKAAGKISASSVKPAPMSIVSDVEAALFIVKVTVETLEGSV